MSKTKEKKDSLTLSVIRGSALCWNCCSREFWKEEEEIYRLDTTPGPIVWSRWKEDATHPILRSGKRITRAKKKKKKGKKGTEGEGEGAGALQFYKLSRGNSSSRHNALENVQSYTHSEGIEKEKRDDVSIYLIENTTLARRSTSAWKVPFFTAKGMRQQQIWKEEQEEEEEEEKNERSICLFVNYN